MEISPETQVNHARRVLEAKGYLVRDDNILGADWSSMDLLPCPAFQQLRQLVANAEIAAVGVLDRDRLQAQGLPRLVFLAE